MAEALGDLAWYRMAVPAMVKVVKAAEAAAESSDVSESSRDKQDASGSAKSVSDTLAARINGSSSPSIWLAAACLLEVEQEMKWWRNIAKDWHS